MAKAQNTFEIIMIVCIIALAGCASKRPVLYPNDKLKQVGNEQAQADIDECMRLATEYGAKEDAGGKIVKNTTASAAVGAAAGAAIAAVLGGDVGRGAAAGGAGSGAATATRGAIDSRDPHALFQSFVEKCLREKGYETIGWR
jgi:hypothetical protein